MAASRDLVFEIGCEELPALPLYKATEQMGDLVRAGLQAAHLSFGEVSCTSTPRRITTLIYDLAEETEPLEQSFRGPAAAAAYDADGAPTKAALGFARSKGIDPADLVVREDDGGSYVWAEVTTPARPAQDILLDVLASAANNITWPRSQRWGDTPYRFLRPVRWLVCLFGDEIIPVEFCGLTAGRISSGHRLMGPKTLEIADAASYESALEAAHVMVSTAQRADSIRSQIDALDAEMGLVADTPAKTFNEVVDLVEWPTVLKADFEEEFLDAPHEIICETMLANQRYFPMYDADGGLTNHFLLVSNGDPAYNASIVAGNERVVRARLADAKFFYDEDLKRPIELLVEQLAGLGFQERLGSMLDKTCRIESLAAAIADAQGASDKIKSDAVRAAHLSKADLVSGAVVEFTTQQGVMGGYYAAAAGEDPSVSLAITQHYRPRFAGDDLPDELVGRIVAIADKLDTVCGIFAIDEAPTGSSDPFAIRRAAIGIINMLREEPQISLAAAISAALDGLAAQGVDFDRMAVEAAVTDFFIGRLASIARDEGVSPDTIDAVKAVGVLEPAEFLARSHALEDARTSSPEVFDDLASAYTRANNLRDPKLGSDVDTSLLGPREQDLLDAINDASARVASSLAGSGGYPAAIQDLAALRAPIDDFFDDVMVMDDDPALRMNRLRLLNRFIDAFRDVADVGKMVRRN